jgi:hypothetical protein
MGRADHLKPWIIKKGEKRNPSGVSKDVTEALKYARSKSKDALRIAWCIAVDESAKDQDRLKAIELVLDRGLGKPAQIQVNVDDREMPSQQAMSNTARELLNEMVSLREKEKTYDTELVANDHEERDDDQREESGSD